MSSTGRSCLVALCHNGSMIYRDVARSLMEAGWGSRVEDAKAAHGFDAIDHQWFTGFPRVDTLRDSAMDSAKTNGYSHVLFLDCDMAWPTDVLRRMLAHHADGIVAGLYVLKAPPYAPVAMTDRHQAEGSTVDQFFHVDLNGSEMIPCDVVGMGCTLVPVSVLDVIGPRPWFEYKNDDHGWPSVTEDVPFCLKAKAAGVPIALDPTIRCLHYAIEPKDVRHYRRYVQAQTDTRERLPISLTLTPVDEVTA